MTAWKEVDNLAEDKGGDTYYFDEEGRRTDSKQHPGKLEVAGRRLYQAKLIIEPFRQPGTVSGNGAGAGRCAEDHRRDR